MPMKLVSFTYSLHRNDGLAKRVLKENYQSSTMFLKDDRTKLLFKWLMPWNSYLKAIAIYLKLKLEKHFVHFPPKIMPYARCWKSHPFLEIVTIKFSWMETFCSMEVELTWFALWNEAVEGYLLFKKRNINGAWRSGLRRLLIRAEDWQVGKLFVKTLFVDENFHS